MSTLTFGDVVAEVAPDLGGALLRLTLGGREILRAALNRDAVAADPRNAACYPCVPWFGRISGGFEFGGRRFNLAPTLPICDPVNPLHGEGWINPWTITEKSAHTMTCSLHHAPAPHRFPFAFSAEQKFSLRDNGLDIMLQLTNTGDETMPAGLGLHPFFPRKLGARVQFVAARCWSADENGLWREAPAEIDFTGARPLPTAATDCSYIGWNGAGSIDDGDCLVTISSDAPYLHLYAPANEDFFCLEPLTQLPGKFGETILDARTTVSLRLSISVAAGN